MSESTREQRDHDIVRAYGEGVPGTELARRYGVSRQRIDQILKREGAVAAEDARVVRLQRREAETEQLVRDFAETHSSSIHRLAKSGSSRSDVEEKFALLEPSIPIAVAKAAILKSGALFDVRREDVHFDSILVEAGVWYVLARANNLSGDVSMALEELTLLEMSTIADGLASLDVETTQVRSILLAIGAARRQLTQVPELTISKTKFDQRRDAIVLELGLTTRPGGLVWPTTSQTVMKRLGGGYWKDALASIGIAASSLGRSRGLIVFQELDYDTAVTHFLEHCEATGTSRSLDAYGNWVQHEERAGRQRPSGPAVRNYFGSWIIARRTQAHQPHTVANSSLDLGGAASIARTGLHDATLARETAIRDLLSATALERSAILADFVKDYMGEFEVRRRRWMRSMVAADSTAVARRLSLPGLGRAQAQALNATPPRTDEALTDMYLDRLLVGAAGPRNADGWLLPNVQAQLDGISDFDVLAARVMRELRNLYTHDSTEAETRLTTAVGELGSVDQHFVTERRLTRRFLTVWLGSEDAKRLSRLSESVLSTWRAMLAAEAVQNA